MAPYGYYFEATVSHKCLAPPESGALAALTIALPSLCYTVLLFSFAYPYLL